MPDTLSVLGLHKFLSGPENLLQHCISDFCSMHRTGGVSMRCFKEFTVFFCLVFWGNTEWGEKMMLENSVTASYTSMRC